MSNVEQIQIGIKQFIEEELANKAMGFRKFTLYFAMPYIDNKVVEYVNNLKGLIPEMFTEDGNIKIDEVYNSAKFAIKKTGQFEFMGIIFNETDIDKLYAHIRR
jgi:hypothetical protein